MNSNPSRQRAFRPKTVGLFVIPGLAALVLTGVLFAAGRLSLLESFLAVVGFAFMTTIGVRVANPPQRHANSKTGKNGLDTSVTSFADILAEPCIIVDDRVVVIYANPAASRHFPRMRTGDPLAFTLRNPDLVEAISSVQDSGTTQRTELHVTAPNEVWYRAAVELYVPMGDRGARYTVISLYDLTDQKRTERMRGDFVANASHQLRTPLTSLMGFIETLQGPAANDETARARFLSIMRGQAERMSALIDDLLSLSRIELRQHVKPTENVILNDLLREVAASLQPRLEEVGIVLKLDLPSENVSVKGDRSELFEVIENLADNALKYGASAGRIEIALAPQASRSGAYHAILVTDFGPGIPEEHIPRLTERFYRVNSETTRGKKGTGLGLAIVKHIVARHQGEMSIRSKPGEGTTVEILLPR